MIILAVATLCAMWLFFCLMLDDDAWGMFWLGGVAASLFIGLLTILFNHVSWH